MAGPNFQALLMAGGEYTPACAEAIAFIARTSGLNLAHKVAYSDLICGLATDGVWSKLDMLHVYAAQNTTPAQLNLVSTSYPATLNGSPTFTADRGFTGVNASTTVYINTGFNAATAPTPKFVQNSGHLSAWSVNDTPSSTGGAIGTITWGSGASNICYPVNSTGDCVLRCNGPGQVDNIVNADASGFFVANRSGSNTRQGYRNAVLLQNITSGPTSGSVPVQNLSIYSLGSNEDGVASGTPAQLAMVSIGSSLSQTDVTNFYNRLRTYMTAVGVP